MWKRRYHFNEISEILRAWSGDRQLLIGAAQEYWAAAVDADDWTDPFREWHERICRLILQRGNIRATIEAMDEPTARITAVELLQFAERGQRDLPDDFLLPRFSRRGTGLARAAGSR